MGNTVGCGDGRIVDEQDSRARDVELLRLLEANGLTLLAAAVARQLQRTSDQMPERGVTIAGRDCQVFVLCEQRKAPGRRGGHGSGGTMATNPL